MDIKPIFINGYDTYFSEQEDSIGKYLLIIIPPNADKDISDICGKIVNGYFINQIDYCTNNGNRFIKAYF